MVKVDPPLDATIVATLATLLNSTWFTKLPCIELAINTTVNVSTSQMPFMVVHRAEARLPINLAVGTSDDTPS